MFFHTNRTNHFDPPDCVLPYQEHSFLCSKSFAIMIEDQVDNSADTRRQGKNPLRSFMMPEERAGSH
jgi:hypothetical protein